LGGIYSALVFEPLDDPEGFSDMLSRYELIRLIAGGFCKVAEPTIRPCILEEWR
jgi:hypothetical protein